MSMADKVFKNMCEDIITNGTSTDGKYVRPKWEDGTPAYTKKLFGICNKYDLRKEFPAITLRPTAIKAAVEEILWIYSKKSNDVNHLSTRIWDQWADENHTIGKAYGYQVGKGDILLKEDEWDKIAPEFLKVKSINKEYNNIKSIEGSYSRFKLLIDQMDLVLYQLKHDPYSRRIIINLYNHSELHEMALHPCAYSCTFNVTDEGGEKPVLNLLLNQRSQDILVAGNWNVAQYAVLLMMVAQVSDMIPGQLVHMIADAHIYDRHIPIIEDMLNREQFNAPKVTLNPDITNFYDFTKDDVYVNDYQCNEQIKNIEVAI